MKIINLGCGNKVSDDPSVINVDWSFYLRIKKSKVLSCVAPFILDSARKEKLAKLPDNILLRNLRNGIPFEDNSVDCVYHSHFLEHIPRQHVETFLKDVYRVLKPGGIQRIVVPDLAYLCKAYVNHLSECETNSQEINRHEIDFIDPIIEQMARKDSFATSQQTWLRRNIENMILGNAAQRGEVHEWMYDRFNLGLQLEKAGFKNIQQQTYDTSLIPRWSEMGLDKLNNAEYKPGSLYMEAQKT